VKFVSCLGLRAVRPCAPRCQRESDGSMRPDPLGDRSLPKNARPRPRVLYDVSGVLMVKKAQPRHAETVGQPVAHVRSPENKRRMLRSTDC